MLENMHLLKSKANADHLYASMKELDGKLIEWQVNEHKILFTPSAWADYQYCLERYEGA